MSYTVPTCEPSDITAADSIEFDKTLSDFPASEGWQLSYTLISESSDEQADVQIAWGSTVTANGSVFEVRVPAASTARLVAGPYRLIARVSGTTDEGDAITKSWVARRVLVHGDPTTTAGEKSFNRTMRDTLRTALAAAAADGAFLSVSVNGRSVTYAREQARADLANYELQVVLEENPRAELSHEVVFCR